MKKYISLIITLILCAPGLPVFASGPGTTAANFLKFGIGARPVGMGGAFAAVADDVSALYWNPAGLATYKYGEVSLMHNELGEGMRLESAGFSAPVSSLKGAVAGGFTMFTSGDIQGYDAGGAKTGQINASDTQLSLGYGANALPDLAVGAAVKVVTERLDSYETSAYAADIGALYKLKAVDRAFLKDLNFALVIQNIGTEMKFIKEGGSLPRNMIAAAAYDGQLFEKRFIAAIDANFPCDNDTFYNAGLEYEVNDLVALRCGYRSDDDLAAGLRAGIGLKIQDIALDYGYAPRGDFGSSHRISLSMRFGKRYDELLTLEKIERQFEKGVKFFKRGDLAGAHRQFRNVLLVAPGHEQAKEYLARTAVRISEIEDKSSLEQHIASGERYFKENRLGDAQAEFDSVLAIEPENKTASNYRERIRAAMNCVAESLYDKGLKQYDAGDYDSAEESMKKALTINPGHEKAKEYAALAGQELLRIEQLKLARAKEEAKARNDRFVTMVLSEGETFYSQKKLNSARRKFKQALGINPYNQKAAAYLAKTESMLSIEHADNAESAYNGGNFQEAIEEAEKALSYDRENKQAGLVVEKARGNIKKENEDKAFTFNKEALLAYSSGNLKTAINLWKKTLELAPDMEEAKKSLERAEKEEKK